MYPNVICKTPDKSIENYRKNEEKQISGHDSCVNNTRRFTHRFQLKI